MTYLISYFAGLLSAVFFISFLLKRTIKNEKELSEVIYKVYHKDYMPYIARVEGFIKLFKVDERPEYLDMAIEQIQAFKDHLKGIVKKHE